MKILLILIIIISLSITTSIAGSKTYGDITKFTVIRVYDGDTFKINIDDYPSIIGKNISIRINGINAPEIRGTKGKIKQLAIKSRDFTSYTLYNANSIVLKNIKRGKYFKIVCDVYVDGISLADLLVNNNLAIIKHY